MSKPYEITCTSSRQGHALSEKDNIELSLILLDTLAALCGAEYTIHTDMADGEKKRLLDGILAELSSLNRG